MGFGLLALGYWLRATGVGCAADATHMTAPDREGGGATRALLAALDDAGLTPAAVDFVSAHGTGTPYNDAMEAVALARVFGAGRVPVNSIKGAIGHTLGAAGALEAVLCVETLARGVIPPTAALETVDPACAVLDLVHGAPRRHAVGAAVSTSSGFAGFAMGGALLGIGTAMVYPTLLAAIGDVARPSWRASAVGVYRLWRDLGYAIGALLAGVTADAIGLSGAMWLVAGITLLSGVVAAIRMDETLRFATV